MRPGRFRLLALAIACAALVLAQPARKGPVEAVWNLLAKGQRTQAKALLQDIIRTDPRNAEARLLFGSILMEDGERQESIVQLREGVRLNPKSAMAHNALGEAYNTFGEPNAARPEFERAVELDPRLAQAQVNLSAVLLEQGESQSAIPHLDQALRLMGQKPDAAYPRYLRAKTYTERGDATKACAELERAVALRPDFAEAWSDLGEARKTLFDDDGALTAFRRAVELSPDDAVAQTRLGSRLLDAGEAHEAVPHLEAAVRLDPKNQSSLNALQRALRQDGQMERGDAVKQKLADVLHERDKADQRLVAAIDLNNKGAALEKNGDLRGALVKYRAALDLNPDHVGIRTNLAVALLKLGQWDEGLAQMREALRRDPHNETLRKALDDAREQHRAHRPPGSN